MSLLRDITHGCEDVPIRCVNDIDDEVPIEFTYIKENCYDVGNHVDSAMSHIAVSLYNFNDFMIFSVKCGRLISYFDLEL